MHNYAISFQRIIVTDQEQNGSEEIVRILLQKSASEIDSHIAGTILFSSQHPLSYWFDTFSSIKHDFYFHLFEIKTPHCAEPCSWHSKGLRDLFLKEVEEVKIALHSMT